MFQEAFPILTVSDMQEALDFYRDHLEFVEIYRFPELGEPLFVGLELGTSRLGIGVDPKPVSSKERSTEFDRPFDQWVYADDCDAAIERLRTRGVQITEEPADQPWGERIARVMDPDGNRVIVATRAD